MNLTNRKAILIGVVWLAIFIAGSFAFELLPTANTNCEPTPSSSPISSPISNPISNPSQSPDTFEEPVIPTGGATATPNPVASTSTGSTTGTTTHTSPTPVMKPNSGTNSQPAPQPSGSSSPTSWLWHEFGIGRAQAACLTPPVPTPTPTPAASATAVSTTVNPPTATPKPTASSSAAPSIGPSAKPGTPGTGGTANMGSGTGTTLSNQDTSSGTVAYWLTGTVYVQANGQRYQPTRDSLSEGKFAVFVDCPSYSTNESSGAVFDMCTKAAFNYPVSDPQLDSGVQWKAFMPDGSYSLSGSRCGWTYTISNVQASNPNEVTVSDHGFTIKSIAGTPASDITFDITFTPTLPTAKLTVNPNNGPDGMDVVLNASGSRSGIAAGQGDPLASPDNNTAQYCKTGLSITIHDGEPGDQTITASKADDEDNSADTSPHHIYHVIPPSQDTLYGEFGPGTGSDSFIAENHLDKAQLMHTGVPIYATVCNAYAKDEDMPVGYGCADSDHGNWVNVYQQTPPSTGGQPTVDCTTNPNDPSCKGGTTSTDPCLTNPTGPGCNPNTTNGGGTTTNPPTAQLHTLTVNTLDDFYAPPQAEGNFIVKVSGGPDTITKEFDNDAATSQDVVHGLKDGTYNVTVSRCGYTGETVLPGSQVVMKGADVTVEGRAHPITPTATLEMTRLDAENPYDGDETLHEQASGMKSVTGLEKLTCHLPEGDQYKNQFLAASLTTGYYNAAGPIPPVVATRASDLHTYVDYTVHGNVPQEAYHPKVTVVNIFNLSAQDSKTVTVHKKNLPPPPPPSLIKYTITAVTVRGASDTNFENGTFSVTLSGITNAGNTVAPQTKTSGGGQGEAVFSDLDPGMYTLSSSRCGYNAIEDTKVTIVNASVRQVIHGYPISPTANIVAIPASGQLADGESLPVELDARGSKSGLEGLSCKLPEGKDHLGDYNPVIYPNAGVGQNAVRASVAHVSYALQGDEHVYDNITVNVTNVLGETATATTSVRVYKKKNVCDTINWLPTCPHYTITVYTKRGDTGRLVGNFAVTLESEDALIPSKTVTSDSSGTVVFDNLLPGNYVVKADRCGYENISVDQPVVHIVNGDAQRTAMGIPIAPVAKIIPRPDTGDDPLHVDLDASASQSRLHNLTCTLPAGENKDHLVYAIYPADANTINGAPIGPLPGPVAPYTYSIKGVPKPDKQTYGGIYVHVVNDVDGEDTSPPASVTVKAPTLSSTTPPPPSPNPTPTPRCTVTKKCPTPVPSPSATPPCGTAKSCPGGPVTTSGPLHTLTVKTYRGDSTLENGFDITVTNPNWGINEHAVSANGGTAVFAKLPSGVYTIASSRCGYQAIINSIVTITNQDETVAVHGYPIPPTAKLVVDPTEGTDPLNAMIDGSQSRSGLADLTCNLPEGNDKKNYLSYTYTITDTDTTPETTMPTPPSVPIQQYTFTTNGTNKRTHYAVLLTVANILNVTAQDGPQTVTVSPNTYPSINPCDVVSWLCSGTTWRDYLPHPVLDAAGNIADCTNDGAQKTANLLRRNKGVVATLGDNAYPNGSLQDFTNCYQPTWGKYLKRTKPSLGEVDYQTPKADGYFKYFGKLAGDPNTGYYSYNLGKWHVVVLNSNCSEVGGCEKNSPQEKWLVNDLTNNPSVCTLAYLHDPRFSSGQMGNQAAMQQLWKDMYDKGVDVALASHDYDYERFLPLNDKGQIDRQYGIQEFVVGTGGKALMPFGPIQEGSDARYNNTVGILRLDFGRTNYRWRFVPDTASQFTDSGRADCHAAPPPSS